MKRRLLIRVSVVHVLYGHKIRRKIAANRSSLALDLVPAPVST